MGLLFTDLDPICFALYYKPLTMNIRNYNIYFNTHTISGIIICALLYVIFFAGSFSFFREEISAWQKNTSYIGYQPEFKDYDKLIDSLKGEMNLTGRDLTFTINHGGTGAYVNVSASNDTTLNKENLSKLKPSEKVGKKGRGRGRGGNSDSKYFHYDFVQKKSGDYTTNYDMAEFLYRLHFLAQLNEVPIRIGIAPFGYFIAGLTSFLFLFALITGLLLHWDKIVSNFFVFRPFSKWKTVWTDMHTALGVVGFPFQFLYAVTGVFLIINSVLAIPFGKLLYGGDQDRMYQDLGYSRAISHAYLYQPLDRAVDIASYLEAGQNKWPEAQITHLHITNYADANMHIVMEFEPHFDKAFAGKGVLDFQVRDGKIVDEKSPITKPTYIDKVKSLLYRLHFGDFGGYPVKTVYFILGIMGCLVITSGILIWLVARDKNNVIPRKRKFNMWIANLFMAVCLAMLPVTALTFLAVKLSPLVDQSFIYCVYFCSWLAFTLYYTIRKDINRTNRETLLTGSVLAFCIPLVNGLVSNNWMWHTIATQRMDIFVVDLLWLLIGVVGLLAYVKSQQFFRRITKSVGKV